MIAQLQKAFNMLTDKLVDLFNQLVLILPNLLLAVLVVLVVAFTMNYVKRYGRKVLSKFSSNQSINNLFANIIAILFFSIGLFFALNILHLEKTVTSLLAGAGVIGLAVGLAFQEPLMNTLSGIMMSFRNFYKIGDLVETNDYFGTISQISMRFTTIRTLDGQIVVIPNKSVIQNPLTNYSISGERRVVLECGVSYGDDLKKVKEISLKAIEEGVDYDEYKSIDFYYTSFGDSSINFRLHIWTRTNEQPSYLETQSQAVIALKQAFDQNDITIPFPIRTLDFGIKGGEKLSTTLKNSETKMMDLNGN